MRKLSPPPQVLSFFVKLEPLSLTQHLKLYIAMRIQNHRLVIKKLGTEDKGNNVLNS